MHSITSIARRKLSMTKSRRFDSQLAQRTHHDCSKKKHRTTLEFLLLEKIELLHQTLNEVTILELDRHALDVNCRKIRVYIE